MTMVMQEQKRCGRERSTSYKSRLAGNYCWTPSPPLCKRVEREMDQGLVRQSDADLSLLCPRAVVRSSDDIGWQNVRAIHFRDGFEELIVAASDEHCMALNLGAPFFMNVYPGKRRFEGELLSGEIAIIPAGSSWACRSEGSQQHTVLFLYLRPLFVRSAAAGFVFSQKEIVLTPQIGFRDRHICHVAMSLLHELNEMNVVGRLYADSLA